MKKALYLFLGIIVAIIFVLFLGLNPVIFDYYFIYFMLEEASGYKASLTMALLVGDLFLFIIAVILIGSAMGVNKK